MPTTNTRLYLDSDTDQQKQGQNFLHNNGMKDVQTEKKNIKKFCNKYNRKSLIQEKNILGRKTVEKNMYES